MIIIVKSLRNKARELGKQINKGAIAMLDKRIDEQVNNILSAQRDRRITEKNLQF